MVTIHKNVLDPQYCLELFQDAEKQLASNQDQWSSNFFWSSVIVRASHPVLVRTYNDMHTAKILGHLFSKKIIPHTNYTAMNYAWTRLSYIPWHTDHIYKDAMTIYLNPLWDRDWGGYFMHKDPIDSEIRAYIPQFNTAVVNKNNIDHATTPVSLDATTPRFTVQLFPKA